MRPAVLLQPIAAGITIGYGALLAWFSFTGHWILDTAGHPLITDFLPVYAAGKLAWQGWAARAYDPQTLHAIQANLAGHGFAGFLGWHYPPLFFAVAMALALLPYAAAFLAWAGATAALFAAALARIAGRDAALMGMAMPPALATAMVGQNGFFTATLLGVFLLILPRRPMAAGLIVALLAYKPQFGLLIPVALLAGGHWRAALAGCLALVTWVAVSALALPHTFAAFVHFLPQTSAAVLDEGTTGWFKLQSIYGAARFAGLGDSTAWLLQIAAMLGVAAVVALIWSRRNVPYALKAALLVACTLLATPYAYFYDLPLLAVALAFLARAGTFDPLEWVAGCVVGLLLTIYVIWPFPAGVIVALILLALILRKLRGAEAAKPLRPVSA